MHYLPLERGLRYYHCALWENGAWTVRPDQTKGDKLNDLTQWIDTRINSKSVDELDFESYE